MSTGRFTVVRYCRHVRTCKCTARKYVHTSVRIYTIPYSAHPASEITVERGSLPSRICAHGSNFIWRNKHGASTCSWEERNGLIVLIQRGICAKLSTNFCHVSADGPKVAQGLRRSLWPNTWRGVRSTVETFSPLRYRFHCLSPA